MERKLKKNNPTTLTSSATQVASDGATMAGASVGAGVETLLVNSGEVGEGETLQDFSISDKTSLLSCKVSVDAVGGRRWLGDGSFWCSKQLSVTRDK
ncbi:hypothetical protein Hamer_G022981 [Homarus americanus]|uniref:Uncharacterized protein n=1 Tax=Homarus americanus TaxID=6706 RepID=A0A8J5MZV6_HOMAM|nr:hypothetical protein Hamer_G022981 [Homarus americanus]